MQIAEEYVSSYLVSSHRDNFTMQLQSACNVNKQIAILYAFHFIHIEEGWRKRGGGGTGQQVVGEVQSLELHQNKMVMVLSTILIKNKLFLHYKIVFNEIFNHNLYLFVLTLS